MRWWLSRLLADFECRSLCYLGLHSMGGWWPVRNGGDREYQARGPWRRVCCRFRCPRVQDVPCFSALPEGSVTCPPRAWYEGL